MSKFLVCFFAMTLCSFAVAASVPKMLPLLDVLCIDPTTGAQSQAQGNFIQVADGKVLVLKLVEVNSEPKVVATMSGQCEVEADTNYGLTDF
jgi:hypothetical protein